MPESTEIRGAQNVPRVGRRAFLGGVLGFAASVPLVGVAEVLDYLWSSKATQEEKLVQLERIALEQKEEMDKFNADKNLVEKYRTFTNYFIWTRLESLGYSAFESVMVTIGSAISSEVLEDTRLVKELGISFGNAGMDQKTLEMKLAESLSFKDGFNIVGFAPVIEEWLFRKFPSEMLDSYGFTGNQFIFGIPIAVFFSLAHGIKVENKESGEVKTVIHLPAVIIGIYFWYIMRNRGFLHTAVGHSSANAFLLFSSGIAQYLENLLEKEKVDK